MCISYKINIYANKTPMFLSTDVEMGEKQIKRASLTNAMYILQNGYLCDSH